tara:strand:+ start:308 stop:547 length:240 start_codon:yes stop_codon:yes gene_type:complete
MLVHVFLEMYHKNTKGALLQLLLGLLMSMILQVLCIRGLNIVSWIIVLIPFIFYTYMMILLYNVFGLEPSDEMKQFLVN